MPITDQEIAGLYDRYAHIVFRRCLSILATEEDAHEAVLETFARVIRHHDEFSAQPSPLTWMYRISTTYCLSRIRAGAGRRGLDRQDDDLRSETDGLMLDRERVLQLLEACDDETRACVALTFFDECTRGEVATIVGVPVQTVRKRLEDFLARGRLAWDMTVESSGSRP